MNSVVRLLILLLVAASFQLQAAPQPPNIIFILADDLGWGDTGCYGHPYAKTPNIDRLAREGTRFTQFYATGVTCCPSRTGFMTSWFPARYATYPAAGGFGDRPTITGLLKQRGYATGHFGKWHIGPEAKPGTYGIDAVGADDEPAGNRRQIAASERGRDAIIYDQAIRFIEQHRNEPFYLNLWDHIPHHPVDPSPAVLEAFGPLQVDESKFPASMQEKFAHCRAAGGDVTAHLRAYLAEVSALDRGIGALLQRLDELGLRERTLIAFSSDQGPAGIRAPDEAPGEKAAAKKARKRERNGRPSDASAAKPSPDVDLRLNAMGCAGPFRGGKHLQYEGGVRIPFILSWPGQVPAGRVDETSVLSGADWLPTICALTGVSVEEAKFDGEDASAAWLGKAGLVRTKPLLWKTSAPQSEGAIRDGRWKLHHPNSKRGELELYDLIADPGEEHNLAKDHPEVVQQLSAKLEAWQATLPEQYEKAGRDDDK